MRISDWSSDVCSSDLPSVLSRQVWPAWHEALIRAHADPADASARERLGYDELFANQLALMLVRASTRRRPGLSLQGDGRLTGALRLPYAPTGAQQRSVSELTGDMAQRTPMLRLLQDRKSTRLHYSH